MEETIFSTEEYSVAKERRTCPAHAQGSTQEVENCLCYEVIVLTPRPLSEFRERVIKRLQREIVERKELLFGMGITDWRQV